MLQVNSLKKWWKRALAGNGICPICHRVDNRHVLANCPILKDLNLKLVRGPSPAATPPATTPAPVALVASPSRCLAMADDSSAANLIGQTTAPSGLVSTLTEDEFESDKEFCWEGDESGLDYTTHSARNNNNVVLYPSCFCVAVEHTPYATASVFHTAPRPAADPLHPSLDINCH
jgi:hypothetical protein